MSDLITPAQLTKALIEKSRLLDQALENLTQTVYEWADAKNDLRRAEAREYVIAATQVKSEAARTRLVEQATMDEAHCVDLCEGKKMAAKLAVEARMSQLSAGQTIGSAVKTEMQMAGRYAT